MDLTTLGFKPCHYGKGCKLLATLIAVLRTGQTYHYTIYPQVGVSGGPSNPRNTGSGCQVNSISPLAGSWFGCTGEFLEDSANSQWPRQGVASGVFCFFSRRQ